MQMPSRLRWSGVECVFQCLVMTSLVLLFVAMVGFAFTLGRRTIHIIWSGATSNVVCHQICS